MGSNPVVAGFEVRSASEIDCPASDQSLRRVHFIAHRLIPSLASILVGGVVFLVAYAGLIGFDWRVFPIFLAVLVAGLVLFLVGSWLDGAPVDVRGGIVTLPYRIRRKNGLRTYQLDLAEVRRVEPRILPQSVPNARVPITTIGMGLTLVFPDDTQFFLAQGRLGPRGLAVLEKIARLHGISYIEVTKRALMGPGFPRFQVWDVMAFRDGNLVLANPVRTFTAGKTRILRPQDTLSLEPLATTFSGKGYLLTRTDGVRLLLPAKPLEEWGVLFAPGWADKLVQ